MARFRYRAAGPDGRELAGEAEADDAARAASMLAERGLVPLALDRLKGEGGFLSSPPKPRAVTRFLGELALMLRSGLPLDEALDLAAGGQPAALARAVRGVRSEVLAGASPLAAFERHPEVFSRDVLAVARVAEATGDIAGMLAAVAAQRERAHRLAEKVGGSLRYPAFLLLSAAGVLLFFLLQVIPNFSTLFADAGRDPGAMVRFVLALSDGLVEWETALAGGLAGLLLAGLAVARVPALRGGVAAAVLRLPGVRGIWRLWRTARVLSNLATLLGQGVPLTEALKVLDGAVGADGREALASVGDAVRRGKRLHEALAATDLLPPVAVRMVRIGEETGDLPKVTAEAGTLYAAQLEKKLDAVSAVVGPAAILLVAGLVGGLMVAIMSALVGVDQVVM